MATRERSAKLRFALVCACVALVAGACGHGRSRLDRVAGVAAPTTTAPGDTSSTAAGAGASDPSAP
ncbi:MAG: hypothetical protein JWP02_3451, partial [Acidimicrobiales bacterium]|nr:hypothetical protein [Acidimicrobiales bacterium]